MAIRVFDGSEQNIGNISATLAGVTGGLSGVVTGTPDITGNLSTTFDGLSADLTGTFTPGGPFDWTHGLGPLRLSPPTLSSPTTINTVTQMETYRTFKSAFSLAGDAEVYEIGTFSGTPSGDLLIDFRGVSTTFNIPLRIGRYVNVHIIGVHFQLIEQSTLWLSTQGHAGALGNEKWNLQNRGATSIIGIFGRGDNLHEVDDRANSVQQNAFFLRPPPAYPQSFDDDRLPSKGWNIHPRMGWLAWLRSQHAGTLFIEGCWIDCQGQQGDCVILEDNGVDPNVNAANNITYIQNTRFLNWEGQSYHKNYGDGVHGDSLQSQGGGRRFRFGFENWHGESGQEGQVVTGNAGSNPPLSHTFVRNSQYINLPKATNETNLNDYANPGEKSNGPCWSQRNATEAEEGAYPSGKWELENVWVSNKTGNVLNLQGGERLDVGEHPEINAGVSPIDFAPVAQLGSNYVSPH